MSSEPATLARLSMSLPAELFRQLLESAPDAIVGIGRDGATAPPMSRTSHLPIAAADEGDRLPGQPW